VVIDPLVRYLETVSASFPAYPRAAMKYDVYQLFNCMVDGNIEKLQEEQADLKPEGFDLGAYISTRSSCRSADTFVYLEDPALYSDPENDCPKQLLDMYIVPFDVGCLFNV
jgi:hypothetical protein